MAQFWWFPIIAILLLVAVWRWRPRRQAARSLRLSQAKRRFHLQRERLEAKFIRLAESHAHPNAPRWTDCAFDDDVSYVRNRATGELSALVAVTIASEGCDLSFPGAADAVGNLQAGTAVFRFDCDHWETDGRTILNLSPTETAHCFGEDFEIIGEELSHQQS